MARSIESASEDFPSLHTSVNGRRLVFLDGPAGTQVPETVIAAVADYYRTSNANTHGYFRTSVETDAMIADTRAAVAALLGAPDPSCISFGANMTSLAFALSHAIGRGIGDGDEVVVTQLDHEANRAPWMRLGEHGAVIREIPMLDDGTLDMAAFENAINARTRVVAVGFASNALGTVNDIGTIGQWARDAGATFIVDAVHGAPHFAIDVVAMDVDFLFCSAYKFYSPHVGILYSRPGMLDRLATDRLITAGQAAPERIETGTLNHASIAGVKAGIEYLASFGDGETTRERIVDAMRAVAAHERGLASAAWEALERIPGVRLWGPRFRDTPRAPTIALSVDGLRADHIAQQLAIRGVAVWDGHFYALRAIERLGLLDQGGVIRAGFFLYSSSDDVARLLESLEDVIRH